jgi:hypothetical protein
MSLRCTCNHRLTDPGTISSPPAPPRPFPPPTYLWPCILLSLILCMHPSLSSLAAAGAAPPTIGSLITQLQTTSVQTYNTTVASTLAARDAVWARYQSLFKALKKEEKKDTAAAL